MEDLGSQEWSNILVIETSVCENHIPYFESLLKKDAIIETCEQHQN